MKKYIIHFVMLCACFFQINIARADFLDAWIDEDEEAKIKAGASGSYTRTTKTTTFSRTSNNQNSGTSRTRTDFWDAWIDEDEEAKIKAGLGGNYTKNTKTTTSAKTNNYQNPETLRTTIKQTTIYPQTVLVQPKQQRQYVNYSNPMEGNNAFLRNSLTSNNNDDYNFIDYDTIQAERNIRDTEVLNSVDKWQLGLKNVYWENYRGNNIRIEVLRSNRDLKEMRLKFVQSQDIISDPDGSISDMLNKVAEQVMKRTCGKKSKQSIILYERPSIELVKETSYDNYKIVAKGTSLKEYGFRCIY